MERTLDSIPPPDTDGSRDNMSYVYGRDPSILAYSERPIPSTQQNLISLYEDEESEYHEETVSDVVDLETIRVYLRVKPLPRKFKLSKEESEAYQIANSTTLVTKLPSLDANTSALKGNKVARIICRNFTFTKTFGPETTQTQLFEQVVQQKMVNFLAGQNSTVMTYGTTNSGKSYTLQGTPTSPGIIPRGLEFVFSNINTRPTPLYKPAYHSDVVCLNPVDRAQELESKNKLLSFVSMEKHNCINNYRLMQKLLHEESPIRPSQACDAQYNVWVSFAEIYNENIYDLLSNECQKRRPLLKLGTDSRGRAFIKGLKTISVNSGSEAYQVLMAGQYNLKVAATALNARSSRSHCIFTIKLVKYYLENTPDQVEVSTFAFCDLAGSERLKKTLNVGDRLKEAQNINTSLLVLGRCLKSIYEGQSVKQKHEHVGPFRESKLTRLFQRALSGKERISLIVNVNPIPNLYVETQNVLNFSAIAKKIVVEQKQMKRRTSNSRFTQLVAQSVKTSTDWDDTDLTNISESANELEIETIEETDQDEIDDIINENKILKKELASLKASMLNRELQTRQEMADTYTTMMKKLETDWKNRIRDVELQQEDQLEWSVNRVEMFYKDKITELTSRKRRRTRDDDSDDDMREIGELEIENSRLTTKIHGLKKTVKSLRESNENVVMEKNKLGFQLGLINEELKSVKTLLSAAQEDLSRDGECRSYVERLNSVIDDKQAHIKRLKEFLNEAKEEYIAITADAQVMEEQLKKQAEQLGESLERAADLEELLEQVKVCLAEKTETSENLEKQLSQQTKLLLEVNSREKNAQMKLIESEEKIRALEKKISYLEKITMNSESPNPVSSPADVAIKEELQTESEPDASFESPKNCLPEGIVIKTDGEIVDDNIDDRNSEMFFQLQEITVDGNGDGNGSPSTEIGDKLRDCQIENESLRRKCEQSQREIVSLRESFEIVKNQLTRVSEQLADCKIAMTLENEKASSKRISSTSTTAEELETSRNRTNDENICKIETIENGCQTETISERDQAMQTSLVVPDSDEKSIQTTIESIDSSNKVVDESGDNERELATLRIKYDELETEFKEKETMLEKLREELTNRRDSGNAWRLKSNEDRETIEKLATTTESLQNDLDSIIAEKNLISRELTETSEALELLQSRVRKCRDEHETKITDLEKELTTAKIREESQSECIKTHAKRIAEIEILLENRTKELNDKIDEMTKSIERCETEKKTSEEKLARNFEEIENLEKKIESARKKDQEKDDEIKQLQKALKQNLASDVHDKKMEKEMKKTLKELNETKEAVIRSNEEYDRLKSTSSVEIQNLEKKIVELEIRDKDEIARLKLENVELQSGIDEKDREMESFVKNRDEMIAKYENWVKTQQDELERGTREISRLQELLHRLPVTPREDRTKATEDSIRAPIPVVELSDSETKRTTRRAALAPPSSCPPAEAKKNSRKKRLFRPVDDSCIDLEISESVPPTPSPSTSTRSLRTRRK